MEKPVITALNHLLLEQDWARESLRPFATKCVVLRIEPFADLRLIILDSGAVAEAPPGADADLAVTIPISSLPGLLARDQKAMQQVNLAGQPDLAGTVEILFRELTWDAEQDLSKFLGDVLAHRITGAARGAFAWPREAADRLAQNVAEFLTYEQPLLAQPSDAASFRKDLESLTDDCARLEDCLERLETSTRN